MKTMRFTAAAASARRSRLDKNRSGKMRPAGPRSNVRLPNAGLFIVTVPSLGGDPRTLAECRRSHEREKGALQGAARSGHGGDRIEVGGVGAHLHATEGESHPLPREAGAGGF